MDDLDREGQAFEDVVGELQRGNLKRLMRAAR